MSTTMECTRVEKLFLQRLSYYLILKYCLLDVSLKIASIFKQF